MVDQPIDYTSRDYASLRQSMLNDATTKLPEWTSRSTNDFGVVMIEEFAYVGDILSYYIDRLVNESYLTTATQRSSILNIAATLDYRPDNGRPATTMLTLGVVPGSSVVFIPAGSKFSSASSQPDVVAVVVFETDSDLYIPQDPAVVAYGTVSATQGTTVADESIGTSDGTTAQRFALSTRSVIEGSILLTLDEGSGPSPWNFIEHLIDAGPNDPVFTTSTDAYGITTIEFGDGITGRVPVIGAPIEATYRVGGGTVGNVGVGAINVIVSAPTDVSSALNQTPADGGTDPESNDQIRINAPRALSSLQRAVTLEDYANLSLRVAGVAKAKASGGSYTNITVCIAPTGGGQPSSLLSARVLNYLQDKKMVNAHITITPPVYVPVSVALDIMVADAYSQSAVTNNVRNVLTDLLAFENVDFGDTISVSEIYGVVAQIPGVVHATITNLGRIDEGAIVHDITTTANQIPTVSGGVIAVNPTSGGISSTTGGSTGTGGGSVIPGAPGAPVIDSIACGTSHSFVMALHWAAGANATTYNVVLDFFLGSVYKGSVNGGTFSASSATVAGAFVGADTVHAHIQAVNGPNVTDGPVTSSAYTCG